MTGAASLLVAACLICAVSTAQAYSYIGCYADSGRRDLPVLAGSGSMSARKCDGLCRARRYKYFGLQYANECWCGNSYGRYGSKSNQECKMRCSGDHSAKCGAGWRNSIYSTGSYQYNYIGCYADSRHRDLPVLAGRGGMSASKCYGLCRARRYKYFGLQYANECWCGNSYGRYGSKSSRECKMRCTGNRSAMCGAGWRNSVYVIGGHSSGSGLLSHAGQPTVKGQIQAAIKSGSLPFPRGVMCSHCLITSWSNRNTNVRNKIFPVSQLNHYLRHYPSKARSKVQVLRFGINTKTTFQDFHFSVSHNYAVRKSYIGVAKRVNGNVHLGMISVDLVATLVPKYSVHRRRTCKKILWIKKCKTHTYQVRRGYHTSEVNLVDRAMRSETFRLYAEKSRLLTI